MARADNSVKMTLFVRLVPNELFMQIVKDFVDQGRTSHAIALTASEEDADELRRNPLIQEVIIGNPRGIRDSLAFLCAIRRRRFDAIVVAMGEELLYSVRTWRVLIFTLLTNIKEKLLLVNSAEAVHLTPSRVVVFLLRAVVFLLVAVVSVVPLLLPLFGTTLLVDGLMALRRYCRK